MSGDRIGRKVTIDEAGAAGVDPLPFQLGQHRGVEIGAVRAGEREIVDDDVGRLGPAQHMVARHRAQQFLRRGQLRPPLASEERRSQQADHGAAPVDRHPCAQPRQRRAQIGIGHIGHAACHLRRDFGRWRGRGPRYRRLGDNALCEANVVDLSMAEIGVHTLDDLAGHVLDLKRSGARHPHSQHLGAGAPATTREQRVRPRGARKLRPDDHGPIRAQAGDRGATTLRQTGGQALGKATEGTQAVFPHGPFHPPLHMVGH